ncbi:tRNA (mnm(5)s(2)U34)-methyltransferase [Streptococcus dentiloxodontae]
MMKRPIQLSHDFLAEVLDKDSIAVDATMGNGHDTAFLASLAGKVYAFDVQKKALQKTQERLAQLGMDNAQLILEGHQHVDKYVKEPIRAAIFNLGYLPSADKSLITKPDTTLQALQKILKKLEIGGRAAIMVYYGHDGGDVEKDAVLNAVSQLNQAVFAATLYQPLNQINTPPFLIMIERLKEDERNKDQQEA